MKNKIAVALLFYTLFSVIFTERVRDKSYSLVDQKHMSKSQILQTSSEGVKLIKIGMTYKNRRKNNLAQMKSRIKSYQQEVSLIQDDGQKIKGKQYEQSVIDIRQISDEFIITLGIGTPPQNINFVMDTGSSTLWLTSNRCQDQSCKNSQKFEERDSSTFKSTGKTLKVKFASARVRGQIGVDDVSLGVYKVKGQHFGMIIHESGSCFYSGVFSGIMGLGFTELEDTGTDTVFQNLADQYQLKNKVFSFQVTKHDSKGQFILGGVDHSLYNGSLRYYAVMEHWFWGIRVVDIKLTGRSLNICSKSSPCYGVLDTGTTEFTFPTYAIEKFRQVATYEKCRNGELGMLQFVLEDGFSLDFTPSEYFDSTGDCSALVGRVNIHRPVGLVYLLGAPVFEKYYVAFDRDKNKVGIAPYKR